MKLTKLKTAILTLGLGLGLSAPFTAVSYGSCYECEQRWEQCLAAGNSFRYCNGTVNCILC